MGFMAFVLNYFRKGGEGYMGCVVVEIRKRRYNVDVI